MRHVNNLQRAADTVAEASCLVAVGSIPLYFSVLTTTGYEPDKAVLLRALAIVAGGAWSIGALSRARGTPLTAGSRLLLWSSLVFFATLGLSTVLSIDSRLSFWGSQARQEGLWTQSSYLLLFVVVATRLADRRRRNRLVSVILLSSVPVVIYGLLQQAGIDPVPSSGDPNTLQWPVRSSLGQHIFLGSYLVMVAPLAAARAFQHWNQPVRAEGSRATDGLLLFIFLAIISGVYLLFLEVGTGHPGLFALLPAVLATFVSLALFAHHILEDKLCGRPAAEAYLGLLTGLALCLLVSGARASWLGLLATIPIFGGLVAWHRRQPRMWRGIAFATLLLGGGVVLLNVPSGPLQPLRTVKGLSRIANITDSGGAGGSAQGRLLIWQGVGKLMTETPSVGSNWGGPVRIAIGYGPESLHWAFQPVFPHKLRVVTSEIWTWDRAHNIFLDVLVDGGVLALSALLAVVALYFSRVVALLRTGQPSDSWFFAAAGALMFGHLVDGFFGLETPVTLAIFWIFAGLVTGRREVDDSAGEDASAPTPPIHTAIWSAGLLLPAAILIAAPNAERHPDMLATVWIISILAGVGLVAGHLKPTGLMEGFLGSWARSWRLGLPALAVVVALAGQARFEAAATAERTGISAVGRGQPLDGLSYLQEATAENSQEPNYRTELGGALLSLASTRPDSTGPVPYFPDMTARTVSAERINQLGRRQIVQLSSEALQSAQDLSPLDPDTHSNLGNLYLQTGDATGGLAQYIDAERLSPGNPRYLDQQALAHLQNGGLSDARRLATSALLLDSTFWYSHYTSALINQQSGSTGPAKTEAALALYWMHNYWPPPPASQVDQLKALIRAG